MLLSRRENEKMCTETIYFHVYPFYLQLLNCYCVPVGRALCFLDLDRSNLSSNLSREDDYFLLFFGILNNRKRKQRAPALILCTHEIEISNAMEVIADCNFAHTCLLPQILRTIKGE